MSDNRPQAPQTGSHRKVDESEERAQALHLAALTYSSNQVLDQKTQDIIKRAEIFRKYIKEGTS